MVQYIITPWRNQDELLKVRDMFYPEYATKEDGNPPERNQEKEKEAVARVAVWVQRGNCPHLVESTAILTCAILNDRRENEIYCIRAAYAAAFCRFVTGLLDSHQNSARKQSMYSLARMINLPATYVELRHQATHEELPSLSKLRTATRKALQWIHSYYWVYLLPAETDSDKAMHFVQQYINEKMADKREEMLELVDKYEQDTVLDALARFQNGEHDIKKLMQAVNLQLRAHSKAGNGDGVLKDKIIQPEIRNIEEIRREMQKTRMQLEVGVSEDELKRTRGESPTKRRRLDLPDNRKGWAKWEGLKWVPKPIGLV